MKPLSWWRGIPLLIRVGLMLLVLYLVLQLFTLPGGIRLIYLFLAAVGFFLYIGLEDRRIEEFLALFRDDSPRMRRLRWGTLVAIPLVVAFFTWRAVVPSYPPPFQLFTLHPTPPERVWQTAVPAWVEQPSAEVLEQGKLLYQKNCLYCHGEDLDGQGPEAEGFNYPSRPVSFRDPGTIATLTLPYVFWKVSEGGLHNQFNSAMPAWGVGVYSPEETLLTGDLSAEEIWKVIAYIYQAAGKKPARF